MHGTSLKALLKVLRDAGVTRYATPELTIELGAAPAARAPVALVEPEADAEEQIAAEAEADGITDWRFALERLGPPNFSRERKPLVRKRSA
jgi:hypothetical protein